MQDGRKWRASPNREAQKNKLIDILAKNQYKDLFLYIYKEMASRELKYYYLGYPELRRVERLINRYNRPEFQHKSPKQTFTIAYKIFKDETGKWRIPEEVREQLKTAPLSERVLEKRKYFQELEAKELAAIREKTAAAAF